MAQHSRGECMAMSSPPVTLRRWRRSVRTLAGSPLAFTSGMDGRDEDPWRVRARHGGPTPTSTDRATGPSTFGNELPTLVHCPEAGNRSSGECPLRRARSGGRVPVSRSVALAAAPDTKTLARDEDACSLTRHATTQRFPRSRTDRRSRLLIALLAIPLLVGAFAAPAVAPGPVRGDELADAQAQQRALARKIADQKQLIDQLNNSQASLQGAIAQTKDELNGITDDLAATRRRVSNLVDNIGQIKATYRTLVYQLSDLDLQVQRIEGQEAAKKDELGARKAELAQRVREAYEAERTSMLETFLSGASFTDMLAEMSSQLDVADQDRQLAAQVTQDQETLLSLHATVVEARAATNTIRQQTAVQKQKLDQRLGDLRDAQAHLRQLERQARGRCRPARAVREPGRSRGKAAQDARGDRRRQEAAPAQDQPPGRLAVQQGQHPVAVQRDAALANGRRRSRRSSAAPAFDLGAAAGQLRPLAQRHRHRRPVCDADPRVGWRPRRVRGLELCRRRGPGLDRDHRPLARACATWYAHMTAALRRPGRAGRPRRADHRLRGHDRALDRRPPALDGRVQRQLREPAAVHLATEGSATPDARGQRYRRSRGGASIPSRRALGGGTDAWSSRTMAVILAGGEGERLSILSSVRAKPAVPFGGKYRIIDFTLSNCVNSGIDDVLVLTQYNPRSLNDHIGLGRPWDLDRNKGGIKLLQPYIARGRVAEWYRGTADAVLQQPQRHRAQRGRHRPGPRRRPHLQDGLPAVRRRPPAQARRRDDRGSARARSPRRAAWASSRSTRRTASSNGRRSPSSPRATSRRWASTCSRSGRCTRWLSDERKDFGRDVIPAMLDGGARVFGYRFDGYWQDVGTIQSFWEANMALLEDDPELDLYDRDWLIHTRSEERAPAKVGPDGAGPPEPHLARLRDQRHGRQQRPLAGRARRRGRGRARLDRHVRHGDPLGGGRRPGDPRQGGRDRPGGDRRRGPDYRRAQQAGAGAPQDRDHGRRQAVGRAARRAARAQREGRREGRARSTSRIASSSPAAPSTANPAPHALPGAMPARRPPA